VIAVTDEMFNQGVIEAPRFSFVRAGKSGGPVPPLAKRSSGIQFDFT